MSIVGQIAWTEPRWARAARHPTVFAFARISFPRNWWRMTAAAFLACIPVAWVMAATYSLSFFQILRIALAIVALFMVAVPGTLLLLAYAFLPVISTRVRVDSEQIVYGSRPHPFRRFIKIAIDESRSGRPRLVVWDGTGREFWIGIAPEVDLNNLQEICMNASRPADTPTRYRPAIERKRDSLK